MTNKKKLKECEDNVHSNMDNKELFIWLIARVKTLTDEAKDLATRIIAKNHENSDLIVRVHTLTEALSWISSYTDEIEVKKLCIKVKNATGDRTVEKE